MDEIKNTAKKVIIAIVAVFLIMLVSLCVIWFGVLRQYYKPDRSLDAQYTYTEDSGLVDPQFYNDVLQKNEAYELGINVNGEPVFKDPKAAWKTAWKQYKSGRKYLQEEFDLKHCSRTYYIAYISRAKDLDYVKGPEDLKTSGRNWGKFLEIYKNSWKNPR